MRQPGEAAGEQERRGSVDVRAHLSAEAFTVQVHAPVARARPGARSGRETADTTLKTNAATGEKSKRANHAEEKDEAEILAERK